MRLSFLFILYLFSQFGFSQHSTLNFTDNPINLNQQSVLIVPLEGKMFFSEINQKLAEENNIDSKQILERFTAAIDQAILYTFQERCNVSSFYLLEDEESEGDLAYIYDNLSLEYELVSNTQEKSKIDQLKQKLKKDEDDSYSRGSIENGQIYSKRDTRERYMKSVVKDNKVLDSMHFKFDNRYFLFVNQLDIKNQYGNSLSMQAMDYKRQIDLHYTLYHKNGEILSTGISRTTFPSTLNDINVIIKDYFPILAQNIFDYIFMSEEKNRTNTTKLNPWKR